MKSEMVNYTFNYDKILGVPYFGIKDKNKVQKILIIVKAFIGSIIRKYKKKDIDYDIEFLFIKTQNRNDYNQLFHEIASQCSYNKFIQDVHLSFGLNIHFLKTFFSAKDIYSRIIKKHSFLIGIYLYTIAIRCLGVLNILKPAKFNNLIVFSDVQPVENLIVQYCNIKGVNTITLQHGLYVDYNAAPNINVLNYTDVQSKYLLAWGESTEGLFKKYNPRINVLVCGKPIELKQNNLAKDDNLLGVVFDQPLFREYNRKMLQIAYEIAAKKNMKVVIRLHPHDDKQNYNFDNKTLESGKIVDNASCILAHTTSMIYEYLALGYKVFKLRSDVPAKEINEFLKFGSAEELEKKLDISFDFYKESLQHIGFIGDESKLKYKESFDKFHDNHFSKNSME